MLAQALVWQIAKQVGHLTFGGNVGKHRRNHFVFPGIGWDIECQIDRRVGCPECAALIGATSLYERTSPDFARD